VIILIFDEKPTRMTPEQQKEFELHLANASCFLRKFSSFPESSHTAFKDAVLASATEIEQVLIDAGVTESVSRIAENWSAIYHGTLKVTIIKCY
jgi:hypothetical protein